LAQEAMPIWNSKKGAKHQEDTEGRKDRKSRKSRKSQNQLKRVNLTNNVAVQGRNTTMESTIFEPTIADILLRSHNTILDILEDRGYDSTPYRNIAPEQILALAGGTSRGLDIVVKKKADSAAPCERAYVLYILQDRIRLRLGTFTRDIFEGEEAAAETQGPASSALGKEGPRQDDDLIVILNEPYHEVFDKTALQMWQNRKIRMTFFHIKHVVIHLGRHVLVPPHRKLSVEEGKAEMARWSLTQKSQLPLIKHHDIQARLMGLVPGDIVEVLRPSPTAGVARILRICAA
jgi:DNA-directed RNA polymerase subunit H (RpoH/RPB5)